MKDKRGTGKTTMLEIVESDIDQLAGFLWRETNGRDPTAAEQAKRAAQLRWLLKDNPAAVADVPWGWVLRTGEGRLCGAMLCVPQRFAFGGDVYTALMSC